MYLINGSEGYSKDVINTYAGTDYLDTLSWGYHKESGGNYETLINYIDSRDYYTCAGIFIQPPITWDIWAENWETIDTNWNNDII